jgi:leader peptidase (prepilin peptidase)/N-methyltransferase
LPNKLNATLAVVFLSFHIATKWALLTPLDALLGVAAGGGLLLLIRAVANRYYKEDALGLGDVKLMAAAGAGLGFPNILLALSIGSALGLLHGLGMGWHAQRKTGEKINFERINVPAGLGLCAGIAIVMTVQFGFGWMR